MTAQPTLPDLLPDAAWLARVREDAGRWWASFEPALGTALVLTSDPYGGWYVRHLPSADLLGGAWPDRASARLWLWIALSLVSWQLLASPDRLDAGQRAELDAAEARLRAALGAA